MLKTVLVCLCLLMINLNFNLLIKVKFKSIKLNVYLIDNSKGLSDLKVNLVKYILEKQKDK